MINVILLLQMNVISNCNFQFQNPKPEQSVMQALESLNEQQVRTCPSHRSAAVRP